MSICVSGDVIVLSDPGIKINELLFSLDGLKIIFIYIVYLYVQCFFSDLKGHFFCKLNIDIYYFQNVFKNNFGLTALVGLLS